MGAVYKFRTDFIALGTTNLCPCGLWGGRKTIMSCPRTLKNCKSYLDRLVGPVVDRFDILWLKDYSKQEKKLQNQNDLPEGYKRSLLQIFEHLQSVREFRFKLGRFKKNKDLELNEIFKRVEENWLLDVYEFNASKRRQVAFWRVAATLAELNLERKKSANMCYLKPTNGLIIIFRDLDNDNGHLLLDPKRWTCYFYTLPN